MNTLVRSGQRRLFPELFDWLETPFTALRPHGEMVRFEEYTKDDRCVLRASCRVSIRTRTSRSASVVACSPFTHSGTRSSGRGTAPNSGTARSPDPSRCRRVPMRMT